MREYRYGSKVETESVFIRAGSAEPVGKRNQQAGYVFRVLTWNFLLGILLLAAQGKKKCCFFGS